jgi:dihydrofolate synthase/folylpolyglutamate synthase
VIARPASCAITSISLDHRELLGGTIGAIAAEKAGIMKPGVPVAIGAQPPEALGVLLAEAARVGAPARLRERDWQIVANAAGGLRFEDSAGGLDLPAPSLPGLHQHDNAGVAVAALRAAALGLPDAAFGRGLATAEWPARLQRLHGQLRAMLPDDWELWLDGGHNPGAAEALAAQLEAWRDRPVHLVVGMKQSKDAALFLHVLLARAATAWAVAEPGQHMALPAEAVAAAADRPMAVGPRVADALRAIAKGGGPAARVLICGSLYLAGEVLKLDGNMFLECNGVS